MASLPLALEPVRSQPSPQGPSYVYYNVPQEYADPNFQYWYRWILYSWAYQPNPQFNPVPLPPGG